ncbi:hypothetical protein Mpt1_c02050 [Candidatus Methanoplasma termitum]|uniref:Uncharacterized protein n=1 Tax=Candidatus Methanoplasma termitum TaxID=1577791 RepID=A0A0A7LAG2_9ARCH|nr:hypothetical protein Mpt1_c02050 [Candidatus Methanoplasma termitum]
MPFIAIIILLKLEMANFNMRGGGKLVLISIDDMETCRYQYAGCVKDDKVFFNGDHIT